MVRLGVGMIDYDVFVRGTICRVLRSERRKGESKGELAESAICSVKKRPVGTSDLGATERVGGADDSKGFGKVSGPIARMLYICRKKRL